VRDAVDFEGAHLAGSLNIALQGKYATWCGTMLSHDAPIVVIGEPGTEEEAVMRLGRIGFDNVAGYLQGGMDALRVAPELVARIDRTTAVALAEEMASEAPPVVLDVRAASEWQAAHVAGSQNVPLNHLRSDWTKSHRTEPSSCTAKGLSLGDRRERAGSGGAEERPRPRRWIQGVVGVETALRVGAGKGVSAGRA